MVSQSFIGIYFWGTYAWFLAGFLMISIPAIIEIKKLMFTKK